MCKKRTKILTSHGTVSCVLMLPQTEFKKADYDKSGTLSTQEFNNFVRGLKIGLSEKEIAQFARLADSNGDGTVVRGREKPLSVIYNWERS